MENNMTQMSEPPRVRPRPKAFPPPEFPPRKPKAFARLPPAVFPVLLGLLGLGLALRRGFDFLGLDGGAVEALLGAALGLFGFALIALAAKLARRPAVIWEDLRVLPGRAGYATASMAVMLAAAVIAPYAAGLAAVILYLGLGLHLALAAMWIRVWLGLAPEGRGVNPAWHLSFVGFIVGGVSAASLGLVGLAEAILWVTLPLACGIWGISALQLLRRVPPAPLRPLMAIHLAPAALFSLVASELGQVGLATGFAALAVVIFLALLAAGRWITVAGFSALWGSFTFPLVSFASALILLDGNWAVAGIGLLIAALGIVPMIAYRVLKLWANGKLAQLTNAAEA